MNKQRFVPPFHHPPPSPPLSAQGRVLWGTAPFASLERSPRHTWWQGLIWSTDAHRFSNFFQHFQQSLQQFSSLSSSQHFPSLFWILWNPRGAPPGQGTCSPAAPVATRPARAPRCAAAVE